MENNKVDLSSEFKEGLADSEYERVKLVEKALEISEKRKNILEKLKQALIDNDNAGIRNYAEMICGLRKAE